MHGRTTKTSAKNVAEELQEVDVSGCAKFENVLIQRSSLCGCSSMATAPQKAFAMCTWRRKKRRSGDAECVGSANVL